LYVSSNFSNLTPKWAAGRLINISQEVFRYSLTFEGIDKQGEIIIPLSDDEVSRYDIGKYYMIDMNNICRHFFMWADSKYPSDIRLTFVKPEEISCG
jgi:hypothetical protein